MNRHHRWMLAILLTACLPLTSCKQTSEAVADEDAGPAKVEHLKGDEPTRVTLTEEAAKRLDIQTATIQEITVNGVQRGYLEAIGWAGLIGNVRLPSTVVPVGRTKAGLPIGMQIVGPYLEDRTCIDVARHLANAIGGFTSPPGYA